MKLLVFLPFYALIIFSCNGQPTGCFCSKKSEAVQMKIEFISDSTYEHRILSISHSLEFTEKGNYNIEHDTIFFYPSSSSFYEIGDDQDHIGNSEDIELHKGIFVERRIYFLGIDPVFGNSIIFKRRWCQKPLTQHSL